MKKNYLLLAGFASMMAFTACNNDNDPIAGLDADKIGEAAMFEIAISNEGEATTRATRPMGSSAADNNVDKIQLVIYESDNGTDWEKAELVASENDAKGGKLFLDLDAASAGTWESGRAEAALLSFDPSAVTESTPGDVQHINKKSYIKVHGLLEGYQYQIVAYGYNGTFPGTDADDANAPTAVPNIKQGLFKANNDKNGFDLEEVFAAAQIAKTLELPVEGSTTNETYVGFDVQPTLTLTRQVAGILAYMENVPINYNGQKVHYIKIFASHKTTDFYFPNTLLSGEEIETRDFNGIMGSTDEKDELMSFDLSKIATNFNDPEDALFYTFNSVKNSALVADNNDDNQTALPFCDGYTAPDKEDDGGLSLRANTIFGARYILPFDKNYKDATLTLAFCDANGNVITEERSITTDKSFPGTTYNKVDAADQWEYSYDIRCNNFYSIGVKSDADDNEDNKKDDPMNLSGDKFVLRINDAWAVLHNMGVE